MSPICPCAQRRSRACPRPRRRSPAENRHHAEGLDRPWSPSSPRRSLRGAHGGAGCPNLPQRTRFRRITGRESLIFRAFSRGRSRRGAPLQQIWTCSRPSPSQEPHPHHTTPVLPRHHGYPDRFGDLSGEKAQWRRGKLWESYRSSRVQPRSPSPLEARGSSARLRRESMVSRLVVPA